VEIDCEPLSTEVAGFEDYLAGRFSTLKVRAGFDVDADLMLRRIAELNLTPVQGDGTATDISCWMEAAVARTTIRNAGENNGFLKLVDPIFKNPLPFSRGTVHLPADW